MQETLLIQSMQYLVSGRFEGSLPKHQGLKLGTRGKEDLGLQLAGIMLTNPFPYDFRQIT